MHNPPHTAAQKAWNTLLVILGDASAVSEAESDRDGAFSWAGETHSAAVGLSIGFFIGADQGPQVLGALGLMLLWGNRGDSALDPGLGRQVRTELPYALVGAVVGYAVGRLWFGSPVSSLTISL